MSKREDSEVIALVDPDPFAVGLGLIQIIAAGATFLEARRQRRAGDAQQRARFSAAWFDATRTLIFFKRTTDEFETYMLEWRQARKEFRIGAVRLTLDPPQKQAMRRLHGQTMQTANHISDNLDDLSEFLGPEDQEHVNAIHARLEKIDNFPATYRDVIALSREAIALYQDLLDAVGEREGFEAEDRV